MRDIEKELFLNNFNIEDYDEKLVDSIEDFEAKIKGEAPINKEELIKIIEEIEEIRFVNTSEIVDMKYLFKESKYTELDLSRWGTSKVEDMTGMFWGCVLLKELDVSRWDTLNVENMQFMFNGCRSLVSLDLSTFDTSSVKDMISMFNYCDLLKDLNLSNFNTSKVYNMSNMFSSCESLKEIKLLNFDTSKVINMTYMFNECKSLIELDLSNFNTSKVTDMDGMFDECKSLTELDLSNFDFSVKRGFSNMFENCNSVVFDLKELNIDLELVERMNIPCFKYDLENNNLEKTHTLDSDLLELTFLDNDEDMVFMKHLKEKGNLNIYKMDDNYSLIESNGEGYSVNKEQMDKLGKYGVLIEIEKPKVKNRMKNRM